MMILCDQAVSLVRTSVWVFIRITFEVDTSREFCNDNDITNSTRRLIYKNEREKKSAHLKYKTLTGTYNLNIIEINMETHKLKTASKRHILKN